MKRKNPAAVALGRLGGSANTTKQNAARMKNGSLGGRGWTKEKRLAEARKKKGKDK